MSERYYTGQLGRMWAQPDGPNTAVHYLGCHELGDISEPLGDITRTHLPSRKVRGRRELASRSQDVPGEVTTTVTFLVGKAADYIEGIDCPFGLYVLQGECAVPDVFGDYERGQVLQEAIITAVTDSNSAQREADDPATIAEDLSAEARERFWKLQLAQLTTTETERLNDVAFLDIERCAGPCGPAQTNCEIGYAVANAASGAIANVLGTTNRTTWAATSADPFTTDEHISSVIVVPMPDGEHRVIVARGTTDVSNPAEIGYSDDSGDNWTLVDLDTADGDFVPHGGGLFLQDTGHIWVCTDDGEIHFSEDQGETWTEQETPVATSLNQVKFCDINTGICVGDSNVVLYTANGGDDWTSLTAPAAQAGEDALCCHIYDSMRFWVGYGDGELWYTLDGGDTWAERTVAHPAGLATLDSIEDIEGPDIYNVNIVYTWTDGDANPRAGFDRSIDGGYNWEAYAPDDAFTTDGFMALWVCDYNNAVLVGGPVDGIAAIYNVTPA